MQRQEVVISGAELPCRRCAQTAVGGPETSHRRFKLRTTLTASSQPELEDDSAGDRGSTERAANDAANERTVDLRVHRIRRPG